jgi:hypothetical protein
MERRYMSTATKIVLGTIGVSLLIGVVLVVNLAITA